MKVKVYTSFRVEMSAKTAECLLTLIYCNLRHPDSSSLDDLFCTLKETMRLTDEDMELLAKKYKNFV